MNLNIGSKVHKSGDKIVVEVLRFPTHICVKEKKRTPAKHVKVNGQQIYSGLHYQTRAVLVTKLREALMKEFVKHFEPFTEELENMIPLEISMEWHVPPNWETVRFSSVKEVLLWKPIKEGKKYKGLFDADNQWFWIKTFTDCISKDMGLIPEDNVPIVPINGRIKHVPVKHMDDRKLVFIVEKIQDVEHINLLKKYYEYE